MKKIILWFCLYAGVFAGVLNFDTFQGEFTQTVTSNNKSIDYHGRFYIKTDSKAFWMYNHPTPKKIYFDKKGVVVIEDQLEQVIISKADKTPNLAEILNNAQKIKNNLYKAEFDDIEYLITTNGKYPTRIDYEDKLSNKIKIVIRNAIKDYVIHDELLTPVIPSHYDVIRQ